MNLDVLKPGNGLPETPQTRRYERLRDMPADVLATRVVGSLILCEGNLAKYAKVIEALVINMRAEYSDDALGVCKGMEPKP